MMTCTKTENGLLFSKDGKEVLVEDVSHPHFAKHVAVSFTLADIEVDEQEVNRAVIEAGIGSYEFPKFTNDGFRWSELPSEAVNVQVGDGFYYLYAELPGYGVQPTRHVDDRYEDDGA